MSDIWARTGYPVCMLCAMTAAWYAVESGISPFAVFGIVSVISLLFVISGEFLQRFNQDWRPTLKENWYPDGVTVLINNFLLQSPVVQLLISGLAMGLAGGGLQVWPHDWSLFMQVPLALVWGSSVPTGGITNGRCCGDSTRYTTALPGCTGSTPPSFTM